ncbi:MAG: gamma-glutamyl-gamma-aminobutyrate hydrolase family protein [Ignavibacteriae bacterium]|nr:gamma-glutamyl-gamma-aminobutyrate hydrolase family protein [Ignavibacteriota bacterium]
MRIGITDNHRPKPYFENYINWLHRIDPAVETVKLSYTLNNIVELRDVDALLLTGGGDIHPKYFGKPELIEQMEEVNELRDEFELNIINRALEADLPILGICRGMQIMNVALGGTLIPDLPSAGFEFHAVEDLQEHRHALQRVPHSLFEIITGNGSHDVNSIHHQAVNDLGRGLMASAFSPDGVCEAIEWALKDRMPFLLCVQWHPERMADADNPFSKNIAEYFLREVRLSMNHSST